MNALEDKGLDNTWNYDKSWNLHHEKRTTTKRDRTIFLYYRSNYWISAFFFYLISFILYSLALWRYYKSNYLHWKDVKERLITILFAGCRALSTLFFFQPAWDTHVGCHMTDDYGRSHDMQQLTLVYSYSGSRCAQETIRA